MKAKYHLPGLFEFYEFYKEFLPLFYEHRDYFYDWCDIGSIYGAPSDCIWGGGRVGFGEDNAWDVYNLMSEYKISSRLTFSNSLLREEHLSDYKCNKLCELFSRDISSINVSENENNGSSDRVRNGVIIYSDILLKYISEKYPDLFFVSSTTKVITDFDKFVDELNRDDFEYVVPDFRLNKQIEELSALHDSQKNKVEFLVNECCNFYCTDRKACYENVSHKSLGENVSDHICRAPRAKEGYVFSEAMKNPGFISVEDIQKIYMPLGFSNFKIEGRSLGTAMILEFLLYYMTKPEHQLQVREKIYLDASLDLF